MHAVHRDHVNRARNTIGARTCESFVYSIGKITRVWLSNMADICFEKFMRCAKGLWAFCSWLCFPDADWLGRQTPIIWWLSICSFFWSELVTMPIQNNQKVVWQIQTILTSTAAMDQIVIKAQFRRRSFHEPNLIRIWVDPNQENPAFWFRCHSYSAKLNSIEANQVCRSAF